MLTGIRRPAGTIPAPPCYNHAFHFDHCFGHNEVVERAEVGIGAHETTITSESTAARMAGTVVVPKTTQTQSRSGPNGLAG